MPAPSCSIIGCRTELEHVDGNITVGIAGKVNAFWDIHVGVLHVPCPDRFVESFVSNPNKNRFKYHSH